jgi:alkyldihydroxyacetonephosphate synthase
LNSIFNVGPGAIVVCFCSLINFFASFVPCFSKMTWIDNLKTAKTMKGLTVLPSQYEPFSNPSDPWRFQSSVRLPKDWNETDFCILMLRAIEAFGENGLKTTPDEKALRKVQEVRVASSGSSFLDAVYTFSNPEGSLPLCTTAFLIRRALNWMDLSVTVDATTLQSVARLNEPLVLCPNHRSLLDFVILGAATFQLHPLIHDLNVPYVAADAEFSGLPGLGRILAALGAFFVRRGGGGVQPDPALRAEVGRVFRKGSTLEVFLEGARSRGRRQLRLRSGFLRALRDVSQRPVALVPIALSYELLPEDGTFYDELQGDPRPPLSTMALVQWVIRGMRGELPSFGTAHIRLGEPRVLDSSTDLASMLSEVQEQLAALLAISSLHVRALADLLELPSEDVLQALRRAGLPVRDSRIKTATPLTDAERWPLILQAASVMRGYLPQEWANWLVEPVPEPGRLGGARMKAPVPLGKMISSQVYEPTRQRADTEVKLSKDKLLDVEDVARALAVRLVTVANSAEKLAQALYKDATAEITHEHLLQQLLKYQTDRKALPAALVHGAAKIVAEKLGLVEKQTRRGSSEPVPVNPIWPDSVQAASALNNVESLDRWGFKDTKFQAHWIDGRPAVMMSSRRYGAIGGRPLFQLWAFLQEELKVSMSPRRTLADRPLPILPAPADGLADKLHAIIDAAKVSFDPEARIRAGTGHGLADIWQLRAGDIHRVFDAVVKPDSEDEVVAVLKAAAGEDGFAVIPVGGRTNVTSATRCSPKEKDPRPFVALDMRGLAKVLWINQDDGVACIEAGITGTALKDELAKQGVNMGMEPDSMELSTLGGWIATRASGMKRSRYGNIEEMIMEVRVATSSGMVWQHHGSKDPQARTAFARVSTNVMLPNIMLGSEGCLGVITSAVVRVQPLPEVVEYQSVLFADWEQGTDFMRGVARLPAALRPTSCRLMDNKQLRLAQALKEDKTKGALRKHAQSLVLHFRGLSLDVATAATIVFEGSRDEVAAQRASLQSLVRQAGGMWGGATAGESGYALTFAIAYIRDFGLDHQVLSESLETMVPWSQICGVWPAVQEAVETEHAALRLPGRPFLSCRLTQLYTQGGVLYMYNSIFTGGLSPEHAIEAFERLEHAARQAAMHAGGSISHHHGVGKHRAELLPESQAPQLCEALRSLKTSFDPDNVLGAGNGPWAFAP